MPRSLLLYLTDVQGAAAQILTFTAGKTFDDYLQDDLLRAAVERKFSIIGEALAQARHHFPEVIQRLDHAKQIIAFRNLLMHRYLDVDDTVVWGVVRGSLLPFKADIDEWIEELA